MRFRIVKPSFARTEYSMPLLAKGLRFGMGMSAEDPRSATAGSPSVLLLYLVVLANRVAQT